MKFWLNTLDIPTIQTGVATGLLHGILLRPKDVRVDQSSLEKMLHEFLREQEGPIAIPISLQTPDEMIREGQDLYHFSNRLIASIPACKEGYEAIYRLSRLSIPTLATCIFSTNQGILAAKAGARIIEPWLAEMVDSGIDAWKEIRILKQMLANNASQVELLIGSIRTKEELILCVENGLQAASLSAPLFHTLLENESAAYPFIQDYRNILLNV